MEQTPRRYSVVNQGANFIFDERGSFVSNGTGNNYGIKLTVEKFFSKAIMGY